MIDKYLSNQYDIGRIYNSYLVNTDDLDLCLVDLKKFIKKLLNTTSIEAHSDYLCIKRASDKVKSITIDQMRDMQKFLYKTSVISGKKIVVIYGADQMNLNSSNSCLKILEDTPTNSHLFLLTTSGYGIIPTIRSRCAKINCYYNLSKTHYIDDTLITVLLNSTPIINKIKFINEFAAKDRDLWHRFASAICELLAKFCQKAAKIDCSLSVLEQQLFLELNNQSVQSLQLKYEQIKILIDDTDVFDLDLRATCTLILDKFKK